MIRVGQVGIGQWGKNHLKILSEMNGVDYCGFYDTDPDKFKEFQWPIVQSNKLPLLIKKIRALVITTPTSTHYEIAKLALENGVHVFIEKPVCTEVWQAEELAKLAQGLIIQVGHIERFNPAYQKLKKEECLVNLAAPTFSYFKRFGKPERELNDSVVMDLMIHDIDLILDLTQSTIKKIEADSMRYTVSAKITFENEVMALLRVSHILEKKRAMEIISEFGNEYKVNFIKRTLHKNDKLLQKETNENLLELELKAFIESVRENKPPLVDIDDAIKSLKVAKEIEKSIGLQEM